MFLKNTSKAIKNPKHLQRNNFLIYSPKVVNNKLATNIRVNTELILHLPKNSKGIITYIYQKNQQDSLHPLDKINEFNSDQQHLWIEKLSKSFEETVKIKKELTFGISCHWARKFQIQI